MKNAIEKLLVASSLVLLTACGGGGGETSAQIAEDPIRFTALSVLTNGQGVARFTGNNAVGLVYSPEIAAAIASANSSTNDSSIGSIDPDNFPITSTTQTTTTRKGTVTTDDITVNVTILENNLTGDAFGIYFDIPDAPDIVMVGGEALTLVPTSGTVTYTGFFTQSAFTEVSPGQIGSFVMNINFSANTFTINASTSSMSLSGGGSINPSNGLYASTDIAVGINGTNYTASLYGNLNGVAANSISGLFHTNDTAPDFSGSFVGSK